MAYFEWAEDMDIDGGVIDEDHQKLVLLVNDLHTATTDGRGCEVVEAILGMYSPTKRTSCDGKSPQWPL